MNSSNSCKEHWVSPWEDLLHNWTGSYSQYLARWFFLRKKKAHLRAYLWGRGVGGWLGKGRRNSVRSWLVTSSSFQLQFSWEWLPAPDRVWGFTRLSLKSKNQQTLWTSISTDRHWGKHMQNSSRKSHWRKIKCISCSQQVGDWKFIQAPADTRMLRQGTADSGTAQLSPGWIPVSSKWEGLSHNQGFKGAGDIYYFLLPLIPTAPHKHHLSNISFGQSTSLGLQWF